MLVVVEAHGALGDHRLEGVIVVGKVGKGEHVQRSVTPKLVQVRAIILGPALSFREKL
jgi:hypothetical protein